MSPNIKAIDEIIAAIKAEEVAQLDMSTIVGDDLPDGSEPVCGTSACIYGFALITQYDVKTQTEWLMDSNAPNALDDEMLEMFGLDEDTMGELVFSSNSKIPLRDITKSMALNALEDVKMGNFRSWKEYV